MSADTPRRENASTPTLSNRDCALTRRTPPQVNANVRRAGLASLMSSGWLPAPPSPAARARGVANQSAAAELRLSATSSQILAWNAAGENRRACSRITPVS